MGDSRVSGWVEGRKGGVWMGGKLQAGSRVAYTLAHVTAPPFQAACTGSRPVSPEER